MNVKEILSLTKKASGDIIRKISGEDADLFKKTLSVSIIFGGTLFSAGSIFCEPSISDAISGSMNAIMGKDETTIHDFFVSLINPETTAEKIRLIGSIIILTSPVPAMSAKIIDTIVDIKKIKSQLNEIDAKNKQDNGGVKMDLSKYTRKDPVLSDFMNLWAKGYNAENNPSFFSLFDGNKKSIKLASILLIKNSGQVEKEFFDQTITSIRMMKNQGKSIVDIINGKTNESKLKRIKELRVMYSISSSKETKKAIISSLSNILIQEKPDIDIARIIGLGSTPQERKRMESGKTM